MIQHNTVTHYTFVHTNMNNTTATIAEHILDFTIIFG